ncbi:MAG: PQQ-like beta-propeller repeat protein [Verrucomicrobiales bacterium]|nr:PQQ-like beta-propeller repeat protein [Verrucomicrobiales bacterium]
MKSACLVLGLSMTSVLADWPQWMGEQRDGIYRDGAVAETFPKGGPPVLWRHPVGGGYAGPAVSGGLVFLQDRVEDGKQDASGGKTGIERVWCLEAKSGTVKWKREWPVSYTIDYGSGPRATPTVHGGLAYVLGAEGGLRCLKTGDGTSVWEVELKSQFQCQTPTWGFAAHPVIFRDQVLTLAGGSGSACVALDRMTGKEQWRALSAGQVGYSPPLITPHHGRTDAVVWTGDAIFGIDPNTGKELWKIPWTIRYGVSIANPRQVGDTVLISSYWCGSRMLRLQADGSTPETLWQTEVESDKRTTHLNALMCTPLPRDGHVYGVCSYGQLRCLEWATGVRKWENLSATTGAEAVWGTAFLTQIGQNSERCMIFNERGELILARLTPEAFRETARAKIIEPNARDVSQRKLVWSHPAYAGGACFARNDSEIVCVQLPVE